MPLIPGVRIPSVYAGAVFDGSISGWYEPGPGIRASSDPVDL